MALFFFQKEVTFWMILIFIELATGGSIDILEVVFVEVYLVMLMMLNIFFLPVYIKSYLLLQPGRFCLVYPLLKVYEWSSFHLG